VGALRRSRRSYARNLGRTGRRGRGTQEDRHFLLEEGLSLLPPLVGFCFRCRPSSAARAPPPPKPQNAHFFVTPSPTSYTQPCELHPALRVKPSPAARRRVRLLRAAARACTALATTSVGPPVNHADPPHLATPLGVRPPPPLLKLRSWQYALCSQIHKIKPLSCILPSAKPPDSTMVGKL
jgi:hypothetical protein